MNGRVDRIEGTLVGMAVGDALGAGYEFGPPVTGSVEMHGDGPFGFESGEWTDDTQMAICIAQATIGGVIDLTDAGNRFIAWASGANDVGAQTRRVLSKAASGEELPSISAVYHAANPHNSAGNGSLMRTAPVALPYLGSGLESVAKVATEVSDLTHADPQCAEACVLWSCAIATAIESGQVPPIGIGMDFIDPPRRDKWAGIIQAAESKDPNTFNPNGYVVAAFQAAWSSIAHTTPGPKHYREGVVRAIRIGSDTDTVAAIAGGLLGAAYGVDGIPDEWLIQAHGWPGIRIAELRDLARTAAGVGQ